MNKKREAVRDFLLKFLEDTISNPDVPVKDRIKATEVMGREYGMFAEQKKVQVDVSSIVRHFTDGQLASITGVPYEALKGLSSPKSGTDYIDTNYRNVTPNLGDELGTGGGDDDGCERS